MTVILLCLLGANAAEDMYDKGVEAYFSGDFPASVRSFERLVQEGIEDPRVYYNLGNAYFRTGQLGRAVASYERALQLDAGMGTARENLNRAVSLTERKLPKPQPPEWEQSLLFWHYELRPQTSLVLALAFWSCLWIALAIRVIRRVPYLRRAAAFAALLAVMFAASWWAKTHPPILAVATQTRVPVYYGKSTTETRRFELYEGDRVRVETVEGDWARVLTVDGERGWAETSGLAFVNAPQGVSNVETTAELDVAVRRPDGAIAVAIACADRQNPRDARL